MREISVSYLPKMADHIEAYSTYQSHTVLGKTDKVVDFLAIIFGLAAIIFAGFNNWNLTILIMGTLMLIIGSLHLFGVLDSGKFVAKYQFKSNKKFAEAQNITFNDAGLQYETQGIKSNIQWDFYNSYLESANTFLLIHGKKQYSVIPKNAFKKDDLEAFRRFLIANFK